MLSVPPEPPPITPETVPIPEPCNTSIFVAVVPVLVPSVLIVPPRFSPPASLLVITMLPRAASGTEVESAAVEPSTIVAV